MGADAKTCPEARCPDHGRDETESPRAMTARLHARGEDGPSKHPRSGDHPVEGRAVPTREEKKDMHFRPLRSVRARGEARKCTRVPHLCLRGCCACCALRRSCAGVQSCCRVEDDEHLVETRKKNRPRGCFRPRPPLPIDAEPKSASNEPRSPPPFPRTRDISPFRNEHP